MMTAARDDHQEKIQQFFKTQLCKFFPRCSKGAECPFAHTQTELKERPNLAKTMICSEWREGRCPLDGQSCKFAHGMQELRRSAAKAKRSAIKENGGLSRRVSLGTDSTGVGSASREATPEALPTVSLTWSGETTPDGSRSNSPTSNASRQPSKATNTAVAGGTSNQHIEAHQGFAAVTMQAVSLMFVLQPEVTHQVHVPQVPIRISGGNIELLTMSQIAELANTSVEDARGTLVNLLRDAEPSYYSE